MKKHRAKAGAAGADPTQSDNPTRARARQAVFLRALAAHGTITKAAAAARIHRSTHYAWLETEKSESGPGGIYARAVDDAQQQFDDSVRDEVTRRGMHGVKRPVLHQGVHMKNRAGALMFLTEYSDRMLELLAKARCPEFREKHEIIGNPDKPIAVEVRVVRYPERELDSAKWSAKYKAQYDSKMAEENHGEPKDAVDDRPQLQGIHEFNFSEAAHIARTDQARHDAWLGSPYAERYKPKD